VLGDLFLSKSGKRLQHVRDGRWAAMDGGRRNDNSMAIGSSVVRTTMEDAMGTQQR